MDYREQRVMVNAVFGDWPEQKRKCVFLSFRNRKVYASYLMEDGRVVVAEAKCHPLDNYDMRSGVAVALSNLRVKCNFKESGLSRKMRMWIPSYGDKYYVPAFFPDAVEKDKAGSRLVIWNGNIYDMTYLALGLVFRYPHMARKKAFQLLYDGRALVNFAVKRNYFQGGAKEGNLKTLSEEILEDFCNSEMPEEDEHTLVNSMMKSVSNEPSEDTDDGLTLPDDDFCTDEDMFSTYVMKKGVKYFMNPVTGEMKELAE